MIPVILVASCLVGRWGFVPVAAALWAGMLFLDGTCTDRCLFGAAGLAAGNAVIGVGLHQLCVWMWDQGRRRVGGEGLRG